MQFFKDLSVELIFSIILVIVVLMLCAIRSIKIRLQMEKIMFRKKKYELMEQSKTSGAEKMLFHADIQVKQHNDAIQKFLKFYENNLERVPKKQLLKILTSYTYDKKVPLFVEAIIIQLQKHKVESSILLEMLANIIPFEKQRIQRLLTGVRY